MDTRGDFELIQAYVRNQSEEAFATIVARYVNLVYSAALRRAGDADLAEDISQATFIVLSRKAAKLNERVVLGAWLYRTALFVAADALKARARRQQYEREAPAMQPCPADSIWDQLAPLLDDAVAQLPEKDRAAVLLRFFENKGLREVGAALGLNEDAAQKRVTRALDKLRIFFQRRGVALSGAVLADTLSSQAVTAAPQMVSASVLASVAPSAALPTSTSALVTGALKLMWAKQLQTVGTIALIAVLGSGTAFVLTQESAEAPLVLPDSPSELVELGHRYGQDGDWQKAHECFRRVIAAGSGSEEEFLWATGAALAAGDTQACEEFCRSVLVLFGNDTTAHSAERCAKQILSLPNAPPDLIQKAAERADYALDLEPNSRWKQLAKGMAEYRRGNWAEAVRHLDLPERESPNEICIQALAFGAMARHRLGDSQGARQSLEQLNGRVAAMVDKGELCDPRFNVWDNCARAVAVRAEAERLIFGRVTSPALSPAVIAQNRKAKREQGP